MTKRDSARDQDTDHELNEALAVLISSTRSKRRPLSLTEIARWLEIAVTRLGSYAAVAERVGVSPKMLRQFSSVRRLTDQVKESFDSRKLDSVDAAAHLAMLSSKDQYVVAEELARGSIDTTDVRAVVQLRRAGEIAPTKKVLEKVKKSKTKKEYIAEFMVRGTPNQKKILTAFQKYIPAEEIVRLTIRGAFGNLVLTEKGKQELFRAARTLRTDIKNVIPRILQNP